MSLDTNGPIGESFEADLAAAAANHADEIGARNGVNEEQSGTEGRNQRGDDGDSTSDSDASGGEGSSADAGESQSGTESSGSTESGGGVRKVPQRGRNEPEVVDDERTAAFKKEAADLGFDVDTKKVSNPERIRFRDEMREAKQKLRGEREAAVADLKSRGEKLSSKFEKMEALEKALESDDLEALAKAMGHKSWRDVNHHYVNKKMSPGNKELMEIKAKLAQREDAEKEQRQTAATEKAQAEQTRKEQEYSLELKDRMKVMEDPILQAFAEDDAFRKTIVHHQREHFDGTNTISIQEAADMAMQDARLIYDRLHGYFGREPMPADGASVEKPISGASAEKPGRKPMKSISQTEAVEASEPDDDSAEFDEAAWQKKWVKRMNAASRKAG